MLARLFERTAMPPASETRSQFPLSQLGGLLQYYVEAETSVSTAKALTHAATSACIDVLASSAASMPIDGVRKVGSTARLPVSPTPALLETPSGTVDLDVWLYQLVDSMMTDGNGFGLVAGTSAVGWPTQIELADPDTVTERRVVDGIVQARVGGELHKKFPHGDLVHIPGKLVRAGSPFGQSPLKRASATIAAAIHARTFGDQFFTDGGRPGMVATVDDPDFNEGMALAFKDKILASTRGNREPLVVGKTVSIDTDFANPSDSQFLELMRFCIEEACRFFRVPPSMVFAATSGQNVTYANVSQADLHYLKWSLNVVLVRIERALTLFLPRPQFARFNRGALLQADAETRWKIHDIRLKNRTTSVNRVLALEDEEPFADPKFDEPGIPGQPATDAKESDGPAAD